MVSYYRGEGGSWVEGLYGGCRDMESSVGEFMCAGGVMVSMVDVFSGAECSHTLYVSGVAGNVSSQRDGPLRAVSKLVMMDVSKDGYTYRDYVNKGATDAGLIQ